MKTLKVSFGGLSKLVGQKFYKLPVKITGTKEICAVSLVINIPGAWGYEDVAALPKSNVQSGMSYNYVVGRGLVIGWYSIAPFKGGTFCNIILEKPKGAKPAVINFVARECEIANKEALAYELQLIEKLLK